jgi:phosphatidylglycerophosphate synthase
MTVTTIAAGSRSAFPLIRHFSVPVSRLLLRLPVTPNQITTGSLVCSLAAAWCFSTSQDELQPLGALLFFAFYVLDNCDGEVARAKGLCSRFGHFYDTFVDWLGHAALFLGLAGGVASEWHSDWWLWFGAAAALGATINYALGVAEDLRGSGGSGDAPPSEPPPRPTLAQPLAAAGFFLRELTRADFCFILMVLALIDQTWILLPAAAVGAQVYWLASFIEGIRGHHV